MNELIVDRDWMQRDREYERASRADGVPLGAEVGHQDDLGRCTKDQDHA